MDFADGSLGHLDLTIAVRGDFEEGFQIYGEHGSVKGKVYLPWFHKSSDVECFSAKDGQFRRPLGEDAHTYKLQIEGFADTILHGAPQHGATVDDGLAAMRAMVAIARSVETGKPCPAGGSHGRCVMRLGIFAKTFVRPSLEATLDAVGPRPGLRPVQHGLRRPAASLPDRIEPRLWPIGSARDMTRRGIAMAAVSGTFNMIHPDLRERRHGLQRLRVLASACQQLGTSVITLCTGTRDPENMWRRHPDND